MSGSSPIKSASGFAGVVAIARRLMAAANAHADPIATVAVCAIVLLATLNLMLRFPELGAVIESYNRF
jgi:hypothetical protein